MQYITIDPDVYITRVFCHARLPCKFSKIIRLNYTIQHYLLREKERKRDAIERWKGKAGEVRVFTSICVIKWKASAQVASPGLSRSLEIISREYIVKTKAKEGLVPPPPPPPPPPIEFDGIETSRSSVPSRSRVISFVQQRAYESARDPIARFERVYISRERGK